MTNLNKEIAELSSMELRGTMEATKQEKSDAAKFLGRLGGKQSAKSRFAGKTKNQISEIMKKVRQGVKVKHIEMVAGKPETDYNIIIDKIPSSAKRKKLAEKRMFKDS